MHACIICNPGLGQCERTRKHNVCATCRFRHHAAFVPLYTDRLSQWLEASTVIRSMHCIPLMPAEGSTMASILYDYRNNTNLYFVHCCICLKLQIWT